MLLSTWLLYVAAVFVLTVTPGPSVLMCVSTAVNLGPRKALVTSLGSTSAIVGLMTLSALGLGALLAASETLFTALKWAGAAYLAYLGVRALLAPASDIRVAGGGGCRWAPPVCTGFSGGPEQPQGLAVFRRAVPSVPQPGRAAAAAVSAAGRHFRVFSNSAGSRSMR